MVIKREMSLDSAVFEEEEEEEEEGSVISVCLRTRKKARPWGGERCVACTCQQVCVFPNRSPATISISSVYMLFMSLTYMCSCSRVHAVCVSVRARRR